LYIDKLLADKIDNVYLTNPINFRSVLALEVVVGDPSRRAQTYTRGVIFTVSCKLLVYDE
jgi:hypothetical protein